jgi:hypothetical protein
MMSSSSDAAITIVEIGALSLIVALLFGAVAIGEIDPKQYSRGHTYFLKPLNLVIAQPRLLNRKGLCG